MIKVKIESLISGREINGHYTARQLLDKCEEELVDNLTRCDCIPAGDSSYTDCSCYEEWIEYELTFY